MKSREDEPTAVQSDQFGSLHTSAAKPFLRWPGGKRWLVQHHSRLFETQFNTYFEPFVGAGSVFFHLRPTGAVISDTNEELICAYLAIQRAPAQVAEKLADNFDRHSRDFYYETRSSAPESAVERAARMIYLNRTCFNGIYRVNKAGNFNVPIGDRTNIDASVSHLLAAAALLTHASIVLADFEQVLAQAQKDDLVYLDPPYTVRHNNNGFVRYNETLFTWSDQQRLARSAASAARRGAKIVLTNAFHEALCDLYRDEGVFRLEPLQRFSPVSASTRSRRTFNELLVTSRNIREAGRL